MEKFEEKIIDLVDVVSEPDADRLKEAISPQVSIQKKESPTEIDHAELESLVRKEVERLLRSTIDENIQTMIREILMQEVEKAIAREIESLKKI